MPRRMELRRAHLAVPRLPISGDAAGLRGDGLDLGARARLGMDVLRELALGALRDLERDARALLERLEAFHGDRGEMREDVRAATVGLDEAETLRVVEPFHRASRHFFFLVAVLFHVICVKGTPQS